MAAKAKVKKSKSQKQDPVIKKISKEIFPTFSALVLYAVAAELEIAGYSAEDRKAFLANTVDRVNRYCEWERNGTLSPNEIKAIFEKDTGLDYSNIYITR